MLTHSCIRIFALSKLFPWCLKGIFGVMFVVNYTLPDLYHLYISLPVPVNSCCIHCYVLQFYFAHVIFLSVKLVLWNYFSQCFCFGLICSNVELVWCVQPHLSFQSLILPIPKLHQVIHCHFIKVCFYWNTRYKNAYKHLKISLFS